MTWERRDETRREETRRDGMSINKRAMWGQEQGTARDGTGQYGTIRRGILGGAGTRHEIEQIKRERFTHRLGPCDAQRDMQLRKLLATSVGNMPTIP